MDPNLFHLDWEKLLETLATVVVLAFMIERALSIVFENRIYIKLLGNKGAKEIISLFVSAVLCYAWKFDAISIILTHKRTTFLGVLITGAVIAGGSKASVKLFRDVLGFMSTAEKERQTLIRATGTSPTPEK